VDGGSSRYGSRRDVVRAAGIEPATLSKILTK
jgi:hypothetical protein